MQPSLPHALEMTQDQRELDLLFDPSFIPESARQQLDADLTIRPLASTDHSRGHFDLLSILTIAPPVSPIVYAKTFRNLQSCPNTYFTVVIVSKQTDQLVACGSIIVERKFTRAAGMIGHIEDIAVSKSMQGRKLGLKIINTLEGIGRAMGCYKIILDCNKENIPFYEKCGFKHKEYQMVRYMEDPPVDHPPTPSKL
ncbi:acyl-CoA N-acyltransferase [Kockovaella imperatae]|uniref:Glucosamine 6-phosphate N-acetyltransferase n=1 Tax=Kockovaella imperatae TaxID=4999 RepID=A0A1Y1ULS4_9TREE|nr:acyl-CoA N-acyltransferase [Kockovaella imperatae]ORX39008.1 acyl-CoA N-acyltransferase [Kockovaella imperatae]